MSISFSRILLACIVTVSIILGCVANNCEDSTSDKFQLGKNPNFQKNCVQIRRNYSRSCNFNSVVKTNCAYSCALCGPLGNDDYCKDTPGTFFIAKNTQWEKEKSCADVSKNPLKWCSKFNFKKKCPVACQLCTQKYHQCNGLASNCNMRVNHLLYPSVHNANHHSLPFQNHNKELEAAIEKGYRGLFLDVCKCNGEVVFCHANCSIGRRDPHEVFTDINEFLDMNPRDMIIFNFEISIGNPTPAELWSLMSTVTGFTQKVYQKNSGSWPILGAMLDSGKQIIAFQHNGPDCPNSAGCTPKIYDFFDYTMGTTWAYDNVSQVESSNSCTIRRGRNGGADFYSVNNFVTGFFGPSSSAAETINEKEFLKTRIQTCKNVMKSDPNFINVDYWQKGDLVEVAMEENIARANDRRM